MANIITSCRILCGLLLLIFPAFTKWFYVLCIIGIVSDISDGIVARKLNQVTSMGAKLDTAADIVFIISILIKVIKSVQIPLWLFIWTMVIAVIKEFNLLIGWVMHKRIIVEHTKTNRIVGVCLFIFLFCINFIPWQITQISAIFLCILSTFAAIQEGFYIRNGKEII